MAKNRNYTSESGQDYTIKGGEYTGYVAYHGDTKSSYAFDNQHEAMNYIETAEKHGDSFDRNFSESVKR